MQHRVSFRDPIESDWPQILALANASVAHVPGAGTQEPWLENRRSPPPPGHVREHFLAMQEGIVRGFGAVEADTTDATGSYRLFFVCHPSERGDIGQALHEAALARLTKLGATEAWLREYADDEAFLMFLRAAGFVEANRFALPKGPEAVELRRLLDAP